MSKIATWADIDALKGDEASHTEPKRCPTYSQLINYGITVAGTYQSNQLVRLDDCSVESGYFSLISFAGISIPSMVGTTATMTVELALVISGKEETIKNNLNWNDGGQFMAPINFIGRWTWYETRKKVTFQLALDSDQYCTKVTAHASTSGFFPELTFEGTRTPFRENDEALYQ